MTFGNESQRSCSRTIVDSDIIMVCGAFLRFLGYCMPLLPIRKLGIVAVVKTKAKSPEKVTLFYFTFESIRCHNVFV